MLLKNWIQNKRYGYKKAELARLLGVSKQLLETWLYQKYIPEKREEKVSEVTGIPIEKLRAERKLQRSRDKRDGVKVAQKALRGIS